MSGVLQKRHSERLLLQQLTKIADGIRGAAYIVYIASDARIDFFHLRDVGFKKVICAERKPDNNYPIKSVENRAEACAVSHLAQYCVIFLHQLRGFKKQCFFFWRHKSS